MSSWRNDFGLAELWFAFIATPANKIELCRWRNYPDTSRVTVNPPEIRGLEGVKASEVVFWFFGVAPFLSAPITFRSPL